MTANNETGVVQPLADVVESVRRRAPGACVFTDAVQAAPYLDLRRGHGRRRHGGAERAQDRRAGRRRRAGGGPARGPCRRASTAAARSASGAAGRRTSPARSGMADRAALAADERAASRARVAGLRDRLADGLLGGDALGARARCRRACAVLPGHLHLCLRGVEREELLVALGAARASASRAARRAPAARSSRATSWPPWACEPDWPRGPSASPWATRRPRPTSTAPWPWCPAWSAALRRAGLSHGWHTGARCGCWWPCRGESTPRSRPRSWSSRATTSSGATLKLWGGAVGLGLLLGGRRRGRPAGGPAAGHRPPRLQPDRGVRPPRGGALRRGARGRADAEPLHRVQPDHQVRPAARAGPTGWASTGWPPGTTPG